MTTTLDYLRLPVYAATEAQAEARREFYAALRSGEYTQGKGELHQINSPSTSFCCLGVATQLLADRLALNVVEGVDGRVSYDGQRNYLPIGVAAVYGFGDNPYWGGGKNVYFHIPYTQPKIGRCACTTINVEEEWISATEMNDTFNFTFQQIADMLEWQYPAQVQP